jgi:hypothetical protein
VVGAARRERIRRLAIQRFSVHRRDHEFLQHWQHQHVDASHFVAGTRNACLHQELTHRQARANANITDVHGRLVATLRRKNQRLEVTWIALLY